MPPQKPKISRLPAAREQRILKSARKKADAVPTVEQDRGGYISPYLKRQRELASRSAQTREEAQQQRIIENQRAGNIRTYDVDTPQLVQANGKPQPAYRNNNPGNLIDAGQPGTQPADGRFANFMTRDLGFEAINRQIRLDKVRQLTLEEFVYKYAPPGENDSELYIQQLASRLQAQRNHPIMMYSTEELARFIAYKESKTTVR